MIEFIESSHTYLVDGIIVPSVTTILGATVFKDKYSSVPQFVLDRAALFGHMVHKAIETHSIDGLEDKHIERVIKYVKLLKTENIDELEHETLLNYNYDYAGTCDLKAMYQGEEILADIKNTSKFDEEYLSWQLSMYARALDFKGRLFGIWLPKVGEAELIEVKRKSDDEIDEVIRLYEETRVHSE